MSEYDSDDDSDRAVPVLSTTLTWKDRTFIFELFRDEEASINVSVKQSINNNNTDDSNKNNVSTATNNNKQRNGIKNIDGMNDEGWSDDVRRTIDDDD